MLPIWRESEVRFVTSQLDTEFDRVPGMWRGFDHASLAETLASERPMTVLVVDHEAPIGGGLRLPVGETSRVARASEFGNACRGGCTTRRAPPQRQRESGTATNR